MQEMQARMGFNQFVQAAVAVSESEVSDTELEIDDVARHDAGIRRLAAWVNLRKPPLVRFANRRTLPGKAGTIFRAV